MEEPTVLEGQVVRGEPAAAEGKRYSPVPLTGVSWPRSSEQEAVLKASLALLTSGQALAAAFLPAVSRGCGSCRD